MLDREELENEIRKIKLQLLKEELNDKLIILNNYLEKKATTNVTTEELKPNQTTIQIKPFESILFARFNNNFQVWHFVLAILIVWFLIGNHTDSHFRPFSRPSLFIFYILSRFYKLYASFCPYPTSQAKANFAIVTQGLNAEKTFLF
jgi:hypothetical protein